MQGTRRRSIRGRQPGRGYGDFWDGNLRVATVRWGGGGGHGDAGGNYDGERERLVSWGGFPCVVLLTYLMCVSLRTINISNI